jgi:hypothetical protein
VVLIGDTSIVRRKNSRKDAKAQGLGLGESRSLDVCRFFLEPETTVVIVVVHCEVTKTGSAAKERIERKKVQLVLRSRSGDGAQSEEPGRISP